jgi:hypothetical protein
MNAIVTSLLCILLAINPISASLQNWQLMGCSQIKPLSEHSQIQVDKRFGRLHYLKFKVTNTSLRLVKVVITYNTGTLDNIETYNDIPNGGESQKIDLISAGERKIKIIDLWYVLTARDNKVANVSVFGRLE